MDQVWSGINAAKVLVAEMTTRNPNVFYELGLAHALKKPVVLVSSNEGDVPFDLKHIRVIYYDVTDPFWGTKVLDKVAENILSAIQNPEEAVFIFYYVYSGISFALGTGMYGLRAVLSEFSTKASQEILRSRAEERR
jgi:hypothetical protein